MTDYILMTPWEMRVEHHRVQENGVWAFENLSHPASVLKLASIGCDVPLSEIYERLTF